MFFDEDRTFQRASCCFALRIAVHEMSLCTFLLFDADQHLRKKVTFELLPRLSILSDTDGPV
jgi:hypothetical protein